MEMQHRWISLVQGSAPEPFDRTLALQCFAQLDAAYRSPERAYHSWQHIAECLEWLDLFAAQHQLATPDHTAVAYALFYHDLVYRPGRPDNEAQSARLATSDLQRLGLSTGMVGVVVDLILATDHSAHSARAPHVALPLHSLIVDIDLAILGAEPERFGEFERQVRREYAHIDTDTFRAGRAAILQAFLDRPAIYRTPLLFDRLEARARTNLSTVLRTAYRGALES